VSFSELIEQVSQSAMAAARICKHLYHQLTPRFKLSRFSLHRDNWILKQSKPTTSQI